MAAPQSSLRHVNALSSESFFRIYSMTQSKPDHPWSAEALFNKARLYVDRMFAASVDDDQYAIWSALTLELLARAALASLSPTLLANEADWKNTAFAIGLAPTAKRFKPKSASTTEVLTRLTALVPEFRDEVGGFCGKHADARNAELHTGELAKSANEMIASLKDEAAKAVGKSINAHRTVWESKDDKDQMAAQAQAATWATRHAGHRVDCPACESSALVQGRPGGSVSKSVGEDVVIEKQEFHPTSFECVACGLKITGFSRLFACGLGDAFTATSTYPAAAYFGLHTERELLDALQQDPDFEEDWNE